MAAIYSGIHLKLKSHHTPWEDKLKIARFAWISTQCLLPNKEQVLLDWCTLALTGWHSKKVEFSPTVLEGLWHYLDDMLHSRKLHSYLKQGKTVTVRLNMAQLLLEQLQQSAGVGSKSPVSVSTILSVCQSLLSSPALSSVFTTKYELMVDLVVKLSSCACSELKRPLPAEPVTCPEETVTQDEQIVDCPSDQPELDANKSLPKPKENLRSARLFEVLLQALSCYLAVQRQQANPNRVFSIVTNELLQTLVVLRHLLTSKDFYVGVRQQLCRDIRVKVDSILQSALFPPEHMNFYKQELVPPKEASGKQSVGGSKGQLQQPASAILSKLNAQSYCELDLHYSVKSNTLPLLFKFFLDSYRKAKGEEESVEMLCFHFLTKLLSALDLGLDGHSAAKADQAPEASLCSPQSWSLALLAAESLLSQTHSSDIYNVAADKIRHGEVQHKFYRTLAQVLFNQAQPSIPAWYRCLKLLLSLNHLILEPDLDQLLSSAWVNADCMEARVQKARQLLVSSLLQTYTKLRQLPRLFSELLTVIGQPALDSLRPPLLPEGISASLRTCLLDTPPFQIIEVCVLILESIGSSIMPDLGEQGGGPEKMETDEKDDDEGLNVNQRKADASLKLFALSQLLHVVVFSQKTLDDSSPLPLIRKCQGLMEQMQRAVNELQQLLSAQQKDAKTTSSVRKTPKKRTKTQDQKEPESRSDVRWHQKAQEAALLLRYTLKEVDTLFCIHCCKYSPLNSAHAESASEADGRVPAITQVENLLSGEIYPACLQPSCSPMSSAVLKLLALQQMKKVLLDNSLLSEPSSGALLSRAAQFIISKPESDPGPEAQPAWDGQIGSVNASSYPVAHWHLITSNLPLIIPHLTREDVRSIAEALVTSALSQQTDGTKDAAQGSLTIPLISSQLLQSSIFAELPLLFSATVGSLSRRLVGVLKAAPVCKVFQQEDSAKHMSLILEEEKIVDSILTASSSGEQAVQLTAAQSKELMNLLQVLARLDPDGMTCEGLSSVFILLLFVLTSTSSQDAPERGDGAVMEAKLLRILTCLLEGQHHKKVFKLIHGGSLLQAVVSSLLWRCSSGRFQDVSSPNWLDLIKELQAFMSSLVRLIIVRRSSVRLNLDQFASFLTSKETASRQNSGATSSLYLLLASLSSFSKVMASQLGKGKPMDETLICMISKTTASLGPAVLSVLNTQPGGLLSQAFVVEVVTVMLQCELASLSAEEEEEEEEEEKQQQGQAELAQMSLYQSFCQQILLEMSSAHRPMDFLVASLHFLAAFYKAVQKTVVEEEEEEEKEEEETKGAKELDGLYQTILQKVLRLLTASWLSVNDICELEPAVQELLRHLVEKSSIGRFNVLLLMIREALDMGRSKTGNYREVLSAVILIKLLFSCQLPEPCARALWLFAPQIISAMVLLVRTSSQDVSLTVPLTIPTVTCITSVLRQGQGIISNPHHVMLALGSLQAVPLDHLAPAAYHSAFLAIHEALFAILQCYPEAMLKAAPSFLNVFHRLLASIMQEGRQRGDADTGPDSDVYLQCSRLVERMYSHIAVKLQSFTTLSAFMVAQYVTELQKVTLRPDIKQHLTEGIYWILDLCMEQDIKFLTAGLQTGVREVFNELYGTYTHYHKAQRQGEDKYTV